jgi:prolyl-tRNA synthetase
MIEYYEISGCYILRPLAYFVWESIQGFLDPRFKKNGVSNCYFPMFVSEAALSKEKEHVEGFAPEVAWVTKSGKSDLQEPIAIRPTSETIMYPSYAKWIHSHRDLPLCLNQWTNVVRWEFKHPTPFIRTREFLWQEGHTAHSTSEEADDMVLSILDYYAGCYQEMLAVPVVKGRKSEIEKFAGANYTTTVELYVPANGRGIQGATSHQLGQNFAKMFDVSFQNESKQKQFVWQTSWGFSTRSIGSMIMVHSDNRGLVLPPRVAQTQVVFIPIIKKDDNAAEIIGKANELSKALKKEGVRSYCDDSDNYNPGWKFNHWELKGTPIRLELGKNDLQKSEVTVVRRDTGEKHTLKWDTLQVAIPALLETIHADMFERARKTRDEHMKVAYNWADFMNALNGRNIVLTPWCDEGAEEEKVKDRTKEESLKFMQQAGEEEEVLTGSAKTLCIPFEPIVPLKEGDKCFFTGKPAKVMALWGRSY